MKIPKNVVESLITDLKVMTQENANEAIKLEWSYRKFLWACYYHYQDRQGLIIGDGVGMIGSHYNDATVNDSHIFTMLKVVAKSKNIEEW